MLFIALALTSCSSDDSDSQKDETPKESITGNYYPATVGDLWGYKVMITDANNTSIVELIEVNAATDAEFNIKSRNSEKAIGGANAFLSNGDLTKLESTLSFTGSLVIPEVLSSITQLEPIMLTDFLLYDLNASKGELSEFSNTVETALMVNERTFPLTVNQTVKTTKLENIGSLTVDGTDYTDVIKTNLALELDVTYAVDISGVTSNKTFLEKQTIVSTDIYFSKEIGVIKSETTEQYNLSDKFIDFVENTLEEEVPFTKSSSVSNTQELDFFVAAN